MKKILSLILVITIMLSLAACGKTEVNEEVNNETEVENQVSEEKVPAVEQDKETEEKVEETKPPQKPAEKPAETPEVKPTQKPEENVEETPSTVGNALLADFKARANSSSSALTIAEGIISNKIIPFVGAAMAVEKGYLAGFDNEITNFKEGATFGPMIGTIPFIGYVFVLEDGQDASAFISSLKASANLRWNICTEAEEMVAGNVGNKVFFVMCNKTFEK